MISFGSDNHAAIHPQILEALAASNSGHAPSYGTDEPTAQLEQLLKTFFGPNSSSFLVFNGTAANVLGVQAFLQPHQSLLCADVSHINVDECGAPEFFTRSKIISVPSQNGLLSVKSLQPFLQRAGDQHFSQVAGLSLTLPSELGTCYTLSELQQLTSWARSEKLFIHIDGARLINALFHLNLSLSDFGQKIDFDVLSFGGTKNGLMFGELVIFKSKQHSKNFKYLRKQGAQLPSKTRFMACQFLAYFKEDLYLQIAKKSCSLAELLLQKVSPIPGVKITRPRQSNAVFAIIPQPWAKRLKESYFFYIWDEATWECRWMISWDLKEEHIIDFAQKLKELSDEIPSPQLP